MTEREATGYELKYKSTSAGMYMCHERYSGTGKGFSFGSGASVEIKGGATQMLIWVGEETKEKLRKVQERYSSTHYLWVNVDPEEQQVALPENTIAISFRKEQGGYMAGYAVALNGQRKVGFIGEEEDWDSKRYYYGFYQGLNDGAADLAAQNGKPASEVVVDLYCTYIPVDAAEEEIAPLLDQWKAAGVQTVMVGIPERGNNLNTSGGVNWLCARETRSRGMQMIAAEWEDLSYKNVMASVKMNATQAVYDIGCSHIENQWKGGETYIYDVSTGSVVLEFAKVNYGVFTREDLKILTKSIADGNIQVNGDITVPLDESAYSYVTLHVE